MKRCRNNYTVEEAEKSELHFSRLKEPGGQINRGSSSGYQKGKVMQMNTSYLGIIPQFYLNIRLV